MGCHDGGTRAKLVAPALCLLLGLAACGSSEKSGAARPSPLPTALPTRCVAASPPATPLPFPADLPPIGFPPGAVQVPLTVRSRGKSRIELEVPEGVHGTFRFFLHAFKAAGPEMALLEREYDGIDAELWFSYAGRFGRVLIVAGCDSSGVSIEVARA